MSNSHHHFTLFFASLFFSSYRCQGDTDRCIDQTASRIDSLRGLANLGRFCGPCPLVNVHGCTLSPPRDTSQTIHYHYTSYSHTTPPNYTLHLQHQTPISPCSLQPLSSSYLLTSPSQLRSLFQQVTMMFTSALYCTAHSVAKVSLGDPGSVPRCRTPLAVTDGFCSTAISPM